MNDLDTCPPGQDLSASQLLATRFHSPRLHAWFALPTTESVARCPIIDVSLGGARLAIGLRVESRLRVGERVALMIHLDVAPERFLPVQAEVLRVGAGETAVRFVRAPPVELLRLIVPLRRLPPRAALERRGARPR